MSDNVVTYGFVNSDNIIINHATFVDGDTATVERVRNEYGAFAAYKVKDLTKEVLTIGVNYWNGERFIHPSPYPSWVFDAEQNEWFPPLSTKPNDGNIYVWVSEEQGWVTVVSPHIGWVANTEKNLWEPPRKKPNGNYEWDDELEDWKEIV